MDCDVQIYFSDVVIESKWPKSKKFTQEGEGLGERMKNAFNQGFIDNYKRVILIGSDLPDITAEVMNKGLESLKSKEVVFGPAEDGGYYLVGLSKMVDSIFDDKTWSTENLLEVTLNELKEQSVSYTLLQEMNDIDTVEDLNKSSIADKFSYLQSLK